MAERAIAALGGPSDLHITTHAPEPRARRPSRPTRPRRSPCPATGWATRWRPATRSAPPSPPWPPAPRSSSSTARSATPPTPRSFKRSAPTATSRCSSPSSSWWPAAVGLAVRGYVPFASTFAVFFSRAYDFIRMAGISEVNIRLVGLARRGRDRRGRPVADGVGGPGRAARGARLGRAVPGRRHLAPRAWSPPMADTARHRVPAHHPRRLPGALPARRGLPGRRIQGPPRRARRPGRPDRRRRDAARVPGRRRRTRCRRHRRAGHRRLLGQTDRPRHPRRRLPGDRQPPGGGRGPLPRRRARQRRAGGTGRRRRAAAAGRAPGRAGAARLGHARRTARRRRHLRTATSPTPPAGSSRPPTHTRRFP